MSAQLRLELLELRKKLGDANGGMTDHINDEGRTLDILRLLEKHKVVPAPILRETKLGLVLNKYRKSTNAEIATLAKTIMMTWKSAIRGTGSPAVSTSAAVASTKKVLADGSAGTTATSSSNASSSSPSNASVPAPEGASAAEGFTLGETGDAVRNKVQEMLKSALGKQPDDCFVPATEIIVRVEKCMFETFGQSTSKQYKMKARDLQFNLSDPNNPDLNRRLFQADVAPEALVTMTTIELASEAARKEKKAAADYDMDARRTDYDDDNDKGATDMFRCGKCGKRRCSYFQKQTRSADEPMTTFIRCLECNNRWKQG